MSHILIYILEKGIMMPYQRYCFIIRYHFERNTAKTCYLKKINEMEGYGITSFNPSVLFFENSEEQLIHPFFLWLQLQYFAHFYHLFPFHYYILLLNVALYPTCVCMIRTLLILILNRKKHIINIWWYFLLKYSLLEMR